MVSIRSLKQALPVALSLVVGMGIGWYLHDLHRAPETSADTLAPVRVSESDLTFISPLVGMSSPATAVFPELDPIKSDIQSIIDKEIAAGNANDVGVFFRLPRNGHEFGVNETDNFDPGSLIKVPIMIAYLREAQDDPAVLQKRIRYIPSTVPTLPNELRPQLTPNAYYTVEELIKAMIVDSDNASKDLLLSNLDQTYLKNVFDEMDVGYLTSATGEIGPRAYVIFLSRLYNATFLDRYYSNYALQLLSQATFRDGLVAGLPSNVTVAHKYGERGVYEDKTLVGIQLHDCGIIYAPGDPYFLCVMTKGSDNASVTNIIKEISATVYADRRYFQTPPGK